MAAAGADGGRVVRAALGDLLEAAAGDSVEGLEEEQRVEGAVGEAPGRVAAGVVGEPWANSASRSTGPRSEAVRSGRQTSGRRMPTANGTAIRLLRLTRTGRRRPRAWASRRPSGRPAGGGGRRAGGRASGAHRPGGPGRGRPRPARAGRPRARATRTGASCCRRRSVAGGRAASGSIGRRRGRRGVDGGRDGGRRSGVVGERPAQTPQVQPDLETGGDEPGEEGGPQQRFLQGEPALAQEAGEGEGGGDQEGAVEGVGEQPGGDGVSSGGGHVTPPLGRRRRASRAGGRGRRGRARPRRPGG